MNNVSDLFNDKALHQCIDKQQSSFNLKIQQLDKHMIIETSTNTNDFRDFNIRDHP